MTEEEVMKRWDEWRRYIADGGTSSWPRDEFESLIYGYEEEVKRLRAAIESVLSQKDLISYAIEKELREALEEGRGSKFMGMKKIYSCDICRETMKTPAESFGLNFNDLKHFTLGGYQCTEGVHICYDCARQLATYLDNIEIKKILTI